MIGGTLEYLISSLPHLSFEDTKETKERVSTLLNSYGGTASEDKDLSGILDREAQKYLSDQAYELFRKIDLKNIHDAPFRHSDVEVLAEFSTFVFETKKIIRDFRIARQKDENIVLKEGMETILNQDNPLEIEVHLLKYQWDKLEELSAGHFSDFEFLVIYKLKLNILMRWWSFNTNKGTEVFEQMTAKI